MPRDYFCTLSETCTVAAVCAHTVRIVVYCSRLHKVPFTHTLRWAARRVAVHCCALRFEALLSVFFRYEYSYVEKIWLRMMMTMMCRKKRRFWVHPVAANREQQGDYDNLILELRADQVLFHQFFRMHVS